MFWRTAKPQTIALRMALSLGVVSTLILVLLSLLIYGLVYWQLTQDDNHFMDDMASLVDTTLQSQENILPLLKKQIPEELAAFHYNRYQVRIVSLAEPSHALFQTPHFPVELLPMMDQVPVYHLPGALGDGKMMTSKTEHTYLLLRVHSQVGMRHAQPVYIQLALDICPKMRLLAHLKVYLLVLVVCGVALLSVSGRWIVRQGLSPLLRLSGEIQDIRMDSLGKRLDAQPLPQELKPLALSFNHLLQQLQKDVDQLTRFSGDLAHELRTPITNLRVETEVLLEKERTGEMYRTSLENNLMELERLSKLVERILLLARIDNPHFMNEWQHFSGRELVDKIVDFYSFLAEEKQMTLTVSGETPILADRYLIEQAVGNLISNALKYTPDGGQVSIRLFDARHAELGNVAVIEVCDNGLGISEADVPHVFERFYRGDPSRSQIIAGDGLGLAIVKSIVELHQGRVDVRSADGQGATFSIMLKNS